MDIQYACNSSSRARRFTSSLRLMVFLAAVPGPLAAEAAGAASAPRAKDSVMTQAELRECLSHKDSLSQKNEAAVKSKADLVALKAELDRTAAENASAQATLDRAKKDDVDAFNAKVVARNALVESYQGRAEAFNKDVDVIQAAQASYSSTCGNRRFDDRDLADIQRGKK